MDKEVEGMQKRHNGLKAELKELKQNSLEPKRKQLQDVEKAIFEEKVKLSRLEFNIKHILEDIATLKKDKIDYNQERVTRYENIIN